MKLSERDYILWGMHPAHGTRPLKIMGGSLRDCRGSQRRREKEGWATGIFLDGVSPVFLRTDLVKCGIVSAETTEQRLDRAIAALRALIVAWERDEPLHRGDAQSFADPIGQARAAISKAEHR